MPSGFFRRIGQIFRGVPRPETPPPPPPGPPPALPEPPDHDPSFRERWNEDANRAVITESMYRTGYSEQELFQLHTEILIALDTEAPREDQLAMWDDYIAAFINNDMLFTEFFETWNISPEDFSWDLWRMAMGYRDR